MTRFREVIKDGIYNRRAELGLNQRDFAELFNKTKPIELQTSRSDVCKYEADKSLCPADKYLKFLALTE